ncbi:MAG: class I SAM-dependent DNA methyltransferase [Verrucomicrobiota bacterium]
MPDNSENIRRIASFLWEVAQDLHGAVAKSENQNIILPLTVLRRLDYALAPTKAKVVETENKLKAKGLDNRHDALCRAAGFAFYNTSPITFDTLLDDDANLTRRLKSYINGFSENVREIFHRFRFDDAIRILDEVGRLYLVLTRFNEKSRINLEPKTAENPDGLDNHEMGTLFEQLIRRFNEDINQNPGEHFTPKDVIRLLVRLVLRLDTELTSNPAATRTVADPACGTGGIVTIAREEIRKFAPKSRIHIFGQEINPRTWAVCKSDLLLLDPTEPDRDTIKLGSTLASDQFGRATFDLQFANPPYGYKWEADRAAVTAEHQLGHFARFGAGLPRISDGQLLFLQHMLHHVNKDAPSYIGIVFNGSPLFTGEAGSGESEIRRWILENDWLVALVALPEQMFYNTGIQTYLWILSTHKPKKQQGKVMLFDASGESFWKKLPKAIGDKRRTIDSSENDILRQFSAWKETAHIKIFPSTDFGYRRIQIDRPLRQNFEVSAERLARLLETTPFASLATSKKKEKIARDAEIRDGKQLQHAILAVLRQLPAGRVTNRPMFEDRLADALKKSDIKLKKPLFKAIVDALSERDESADPVIAETTAVKRSELPIRIRRAELNHHAPETPRFGGFHLDHPDDPKLVLLTRYESDNDLKDFENVPLGTDIIAYFEREVLPHAPDAWINPDFADEKDQGVGKVGYEINFNRHFYTYQPPRPVAEIDKNIRKVEKNILAMLKEVMG